METLLEQTLRLKTMRPAGSGGPNPRFRGKEKPGSLPIVGNINQAAMTLSIPPELEALVEQRAQVKG